VDNELEGTDNVSTSVFLVDYVVRLLVGLGVVEVEVVVLNSRGLRVVLWDAKVLVARMKPNADGSTDQDMWK
jgi:hypothetical protein